jgi:hypothetical protein
MDRLPIPRSIAEVTPAWLTRALRAGGGPPEARVAEVEVAGAGADGGFLDRTVRLCLTHDGSADGAPRSLLVKLPPAAPADRRFVEATFAQEREILFYRTLAAQVAVRTPRLYYGDFVQRPGARYIPTLLRAANRLPLPLLSLMVGLALRRAPGPGRPSIVLLEDLAPARPGDPLAGCSPDQAQRVLDALAALHAGPAERLTARGPHWLAPLSIASRLLHLFYGRARQAFAARFADALGTPARQALDWLDVHGPAALARLGRPPRTVLHGDCRPDNVLFGADGQVAFVDWQGVCVGRGAMDVAGFVTTSAPGPQAERRWVDGYVEALSRRGAPIERRAFERDYRLAKLCVLHRCVAAFSMLDLESARGERLARVWVGRLMRLLPEGDLDELLDPCH